MSGYGGGPYTPSAANQVVAAALAMLPGTSPALNAMFDPLTLPGTLGLWDAAYAALTGSAANQWPDLSANANHIVQATGGNMPAWSATSFAGAPGLTFDGANSFMTLTTPITTANTIISAYYSTGAVSRAPWLGSTIAAGGFTDMSGGIDGLKLMEWNEAAGSRSQVSVNGWDRKGSAATPLSTAGAGAVLKPTTPSIMSLTTIASPGRYQNPASALRFSQIARDRSTAARSDPCVHSILYANSTVLTPFQRWQVERAIVSTLILRGANLTTSAMLTRLLVIFKGDSQTFGSSAYYPELCLATSAKPYGIVNLGIGGETCATMITAAPTEILPLVLAARAAGVTSITIVVRAGTNDIQVGGLTGAQAFANVQTYCALLNSYSSYGVAINVVLVPCMDRAIGGAIAGFRTNRNAMNVLFNANWPSMCRYYCAGLATDPNIGVDGAPDTNVGVYFNDGIHNTELGATVSASYVIPGIDFCQAGS